MVKVVQYNNKKLYITAYNTAIEKDLLLYVSTTDDFNLDTVFWMLRDFIKPFNDDYSQLEKLAIVILLRSISVGEVYELKTKCHSCKKQFEFSQQLTNLIQEGTLTSDTFFEDIKIKEAFTDKYEDFCDIDIDELDTDKYDRLTNFIDVNKTKFNFTEITLCPYCKKENSIIFTENLVLKNLSEDSIENYYKTISSMIYNGKYTKLDLDSMLPFERNIYLGLLNKEIEEQNKRKNLK